MQTPQEAIIFFFLNNQLSRVLAAGNIHGRFLFLIHADDFGNGYQTRRPGSLNGG
ncbi:hypothetical protein SDC9_210853 [bioreactor metagenome]|uniref:Uncharacterized protein n=1 Tax=bioreactor metagenome TaxID=1076179 RepID=A0A645JK52_9ZZZZ